MRLSCTGLYAISKYGYPPSIPQLFQALDEMADLGFRYVELEGVGETNLREVAEHIPAILDRCRARGLQVNNFCPVLPELVSLDPVRRRRGQALFDLAVDVAVRLGCGTIQSDSFAPPLRFLGARPYADAIKFGQAYRVAIDPGFRWEEVWTVLVEMMRHCVQQATAAGLRFCLEPRMGELISNTDAFLRLADAVGDPNFGILLDTGHQHAQKEILPLSVEKLGDRVVYVHVADNDATTNEHRPLGEGTIDWEGLILALAKHGFQGHLGIDVGMVDDLDGSVRESVLFLKELCGRLAVPLDD